MEHWFYFKQLNLNSQRMFSFQSKKLINILRTILHCNIIGSFQKNIYLLRYLLIICIYLTKGIVYFWRVETHSTYHWKSVCRRMFRQVLPSLGPLVLLSWLNWTISSFLVLKSPVSMSWVCLHQTVPTKAWFSIKVVLWSKTTLSFLFTFRKYDL